MRIQATRLEIEEDVRQALNAHRPGAATAKVPLAGGLAPADDVPPLFRPSLRPSTPIQTICDDSAETGESVRIRNNEFVIGRTKVDLTNPHDGHELNPQWRRFSIAVYGACTPNPGLVLLAVAAFGSLPVRRHRHHNEQSACATLENFTAPQPNVL
jgi:hypothetical protein